MVERCVIPTEVELVNVIDRDSVPSGSPVTDAVRVNVAVEGNYFLPPLLDLR
jgi:hypothetical protein